MKLSIIIPVYNEEATIQEVVNRVKAIHLPSVKKEIIIVDDGSNDNTPKILAKIHGCKKIVHKQNLGKGAAIKSALPYVAGDIVLIQDADLEYNPENYSYLIKPIIKKESKIVYGSRNLNKKNKYSYFSYYNGGKFLTWLINFLYDSKLTDEATGYKVFDTKVIKSISLECAGFEFCPEITVKLLQKDYQISEVPINYTPRMKSEGKKIKWFDGIRAIYTIIKFKFKN